MTYFSFFTPKRSTTGALAWSLSDGALTISGTGAMPYYSAERATRITSAPWGDYHSNITTINIQYGVTTIGDCAFSGCSSLTSITIPNSVTSIGGGAFGLCSSLTSITIPNSVTSIGIGAFLFCGNLTSITIPNSVTTIGSSAFLLCGSLENVVVLKTTPPALGDDTFDEVPLSYATLTVPKGCKAAYQSASGWKDFGTIVEATR
jgi:hypothetical protein